MVMVATGLVWVGERRNMLPESSMMFWRATNTCRQNYNVVFITRWHYNVPMLLTYSTLQLEEHIFCRRLALTIFKVHFFSVPLSKLNGEAPCPWEHGDPNFHRSKFFLFSRTLQFIIILNRYSSSTLVSERWARSWSRCTVTTVCQPAGNFKSFPAVGCHYFPPGLRSPS